MLVTINITCMQEDFGRSSIGKYRPWVLRVARARDFQALLEVKSPHSTCSSARAAAANSHAGTQPVVATVSTVVSTAPTMTPPLLLPGPPSSGFVDTDAQLGKSEA
jgi:hypothetical protein